MALHYLKMNGMGEYTYRVWIDGEKTLDARQVTIGYIRTDKPRKGRWQYALPNAVGWNDLPPEIHGYKHAARALFEVQNLPLPKGTKDGRF